MVKRTKTLFKQGYSDLKSFTLLFFLAKVKNFDFYRNYSKKRKVLFSKNFGRK